MIPIVKRNFNLRIQHFKPMNEKRFCRQVEGLALVALNLQRAMMLVSVDKAGLHVTSECYHDKNVQVNILKNKVCFRTIITEPV